MVRGAATFTGDRDEPAQCERDRDADECYERRLPKRDTEAEDPSAVAHPEHGHIRGKPRPEQLAGCCRALRFGNDLNAVVFDDGSGWRGGHLKSPQHARSGDHCPALLNNLRVSCDCRGAVRDQSMNSREKG